MSSQSFCIRNRGGAFPDYSLSCCTCTWNAMAYHSHWPAWYAEGDMPRHSAVYVSSCVCVIRIMCRLQRLHHPLLPQIPKLTLTSSLSSLMATSSSFNATATHTSATRLSMGARGAPQRTHISLLMVMTPCSSMSPERHILKRSVSPSRLQNST